MKKLAVARQQAYIALGVFLTSAALMRIDACPMTGFDVQGYNKILNLDEQGLTATAVVAIGTRSDVDDSARDAKVRRPFFDLIHFVSWAKPPFDGRHLSHYTYVGLPNTLVLWLCRCSAHFFCRVIACGFVCLRGACLIVACAGFFGFALFCWRFSGCIVLFPRFGRSAWLRV